MTSVCDREDIIDCALTIGLDVLDRWFPGKRRCHGPELWDGGP